MPARARPAPLSARRPRSTAIALVAFGALGLPGLSSAAPVKPAQPSSLSGSLPAGGGAPAIGVRADLDARKLSFRACASLPCDPGASAGTIAIPLSDPIDLGRSKIEPREVGGRKLLHVLLRSAPREDVAWEAIVGAPPGAPGEAQVIWSGGTGFGAEGEGTGQRLVFEDGELYVGRLRRELTLCGRDETLLEPKRLEPKSLSLRRVAMHRLPKKVRDAAPLVVATPATAAPIGSVLGVRGASVNDGGSVALTDDDAATAWHETLKGDGKGEFVVFSAPKATPLEKLSLVLRPTKAIDGFAPPTSLWVTTDEGTFRVAIPRTDATSGPAARVDVPFPTPVATACVALSIDRADGPGDVIGLAEVDGVPVLPKSIHSLEDLVTLLDAKNDDAELAQRVLAHAGPRGAKAIQSKLAAIGDRGKERAVDALEAAPCKASSPALARLAWDAPKVVATRARDALDACGPEAKEALAAAFAEGPDGAREVLAERWAKADPKGALVALLDTVRTAPASRRRSYRIAIGRVAASPAGRDAIAEWLASEAASLGSVKPDENDPAIELGRAVAAAPTVDPLVPALAKVLLTHAAPGRPFPARWLAAEPLAKLAGRGDAGSLAWMRALHKSDDRYLRARAVEVSAGIDVLRPEIVAALHDPGPRVRQSALVALRAGEGPAGATPLTIALLRQDPWTFVRVAAAETLGESKGGGDVDDALAKATRDDARPVRSAAIRALVTRGARGQLPAIRKRAFDAEEAVDVRVDAIEALGQLCDAASADDLFDLAKRGSGTEGAHQIALAAILALGRIHPADLAQRLSAIDQTSLVVKDAVRRALRSPSSCS